jgi:hypothetical protein
MIVPPAAGDRPQPAPPAARTPPPPRARTGCGRPLVDVLAVQLHRHRPVALHVQPRQVVEVGQMAGTAARVPRPHQGVHGQPPQVVRAQLADGHGIQSGVEAGPRRRLHRQPPEVGVRVLIGHDQIGGAHRRAAVGAHGHPLRQPEALPGQLADAGRDDTEIAGPAVPRPLAAGQIDVAGGGRVEPDRGREGEPAAVHPAQADRPCVIGGQRPGQLRRCLRRVEREAQLAGEHRGGAGRQHAQLDARRHAVCDLVGRPVAAHGHHRVGARLRRQAGRVPDALGAPQLQRADGRQPGHHRVQHLLGHAAGEGIGDQPHLHRMDDTGQSACQPGINLGSLYLDA